MQPKIKLKKARKKWQELSVGEDVEKELLCTVGGKVSWESHMGNSMEVP